MLYSNKQGPYSGDHKRIWTMNLLKSRYLTLREVSVLGIFLVHISGIRYMEIYRVNFRIQSEYRKIKTKQTPNTITFYAA